MSKTESSMLPLGSIAVHFQLPDVSTNQMISLDDQKQHDATVIMFICNHCPYVKHINPVLTALAKEYSAKGIRFIAISSNDVSAYPDDSPDNMRRIAQKENYPFPYLYDETQEIARAYKAACTPDFFIFDSQLSLVYRGQFDDSRPGNPIEVTGSSLRDCLNCLLDKQPIRLEQKPSIGCNIKWKT